jgi:hypothetical protein
VNTLSHHWSCSKELTADSLLHRSSSPTTLPSGCALVSSSSSSYSHPSTHLESPGFLVLLELLTPTEPPRSLCLHCPELSEHLTPATILQFNRSSCFLGSMCSFRTIRRRPLATGTTSSPKHSSTRRVPPSPAPSGESPSPKCHNVGPPCSLLVVPSVRRLAVSSARAAGPPPRPAWHSHSGRCAGKESGSAVMSGRPCGPLSGQPAGRKRPVSRI